jgi:hypothetical protein
MSEEKPSYLGLLNAIAVAESRAHTYLTAWAEVTPSEDVRRVLLTVAAREGEHAMSFAKRINELGYEVRRKEDADRDEALALVRSNHSDLDKMTRLRLEQLDTGDRPDIFDDFFNDHTIDIRTGELLGRYIAEERDSARLLRSCYEQLASASAEASDAHDTSAAPTTLDAKVDALCVAVEEIRALMVQRPPAANGARKAREKTAK